MDRQELLSKIRALALPASLLAEDLRAGAFRSLFRGQGIEFDEVRRYEQGDDIRAIDWNVSARFASPYVKLFREERDMQIGLVLDCSASMRADADAPGGLDRREQAVLAASLIAFAGLAGGQQAGAVFFDAEAARVFAPARGRGHVMTMAAAALDARPRGRGSALGPALERARGLFRRRGLIVILSDFLCGGWEHSLRALTRGRKALAIAVTDPLDRAFPPCGLFTLQDPETGASFTAPTGSPVFRRAWAEWRDAHLRRAETACRKAGAAWLELSTADDAVAALRRFFGRRM
jgi:uncharacterized protein (DUF58 family)